MLWIKLLSVDFFRNVLKLALQISSHYLLSFSANMEENISVINWLINQSWPLRARPMWVHVVSWTIEYCRLILRDDACMLIIFLKIKMYLRSICPIPNDLIAILPRNLNMNSLKMHLVNWNLYPLAWLTVLWCLTFKSDAVFCTFTDDQSFIGMLSRTLENWLSTL